MTRRCRVVVKEPGMFANLAWVAPATWRRPCSRWCCCSSSWHPATCSTKIVHVLPTFRDKRQATHRPRDIERKLSRSSPSAINASLGIACRHLPWLCSACRTRCSSG
ncbi:MAG: hypothetical protein R3C69_07590 [Geminicoccaceae bacterium]